jgi:hypothetical protein
MQELQGRFCYTWEVEAGEKMKQCSFSAEQRLLIDRETVRYYKNILKILGEKKVT